MGVAGTKDVRAGLSCFLSYYYFILRSCCPLLYSDLPQYECCKMLMCTTAIGVSPDPGVATFGEPPSLEQTFFRRPRLRVK